MISIPVVRPRPRKTSEVKFPHYAECIIISRSHIFLSQPFLALFEVTAISLGYFPGSMFSVTGQFPHIF